MNTIGTGANTLPKRKPKIKAAHKGRKKAFATPDDLWQAARAYFKYCVKNPVREHVCRYGRVIEVPKMRAMSFKGLCMHIGVYDLKYYDSLPEYKRVMARITNTIYVHNFNGAAAGFLNGRVIGNTLRNYDK